MSDVLNQKIPSLTLPCTEIGILKLPEDIIGHWTIIYFYPKDDTPGCTKESCGFRDKLLDFNAINTKVFGINKDNIESHNAFLKKYNLNFQLISDDENQLAKFLGVGTFPFLSRDTFVIDPKGIVRAVWRKVKPDNTISDAYNKIVELQKL